MNDTLAYSRPTPSTAGSTRTSSLFPCLRLHGKFVLPFSHDEGVHGKNSCSTKCPATCGQQFAISASSTANQLAIPARSFVHGPGVRQAQRIQRSVAASMAPASIRLASWHSAPDRDLNKLYAAEPSLHEIDFEWRGFEWIAANDADNSVFSFCAAAKIRRFDDRSP